MKLDDLIGKLNEATARLNTFVKIVYHSCNQSLYKSVISIIN